MTSYTLGFHNAAPPVATSDVHAEGAELPPGERVPPEQSNV
jgi:hypothetical protein